MDSSEKPLAVRRVLDLAELSPVLVTRMFTTPMSDVIVGARSVTLTGKWANQRATTDLSPTCNIWDV